MKTYTDTIRSSIVEGELIGIMGNGIEVRTNPEENKVHYLLLNEMSDLKEEIRLFEILSPKAYSFLNWDWECDFENQLMSVSDESALFMIEELKAKFEFMRGKVLNSYPDNWHCLSLEDLKSFVRAELALMY